MAIEVQDVLDLGFKSEMFRIRGGSSFDGYIEEIIALKAAILKGQIGLALYNTTDALKIEYVKRIEVCYVASELCQRRINIMLANVDSTPETAPVYKQQKSYDSESDSLMNLLTEYGYSGHTAVSSHFSSASEVPDDA
jgi:hypothetical protein